MAVTALLLNRNEGVLGLLMDAAAGHGEDRRTEAMRRGRYLEGCSFWMLNESKPGGFWRLIAHVKLSHLYSSLGHRVATPVVVFAVP